MDDIKAPVWPLPWDRLVYPLSRVAHRDGTTGLAHVTPQGRKMLAEADVVLGCDLTSGLQDVFYGRDLLEKLARLPDGEARDVRVFKVGLDMGTESEDPEMLCAALAAVRGKYDYGQPPRKARRKKKRR